MGCNITHLLARVASNEFSFFGSCCRSLISSFYGYQTAQTNTCQSDPTVRVKAWNCALCLSPALGSASVCIQGCPAATRDSALGMTEKERLSHQLRPISGEPKGHGSQLLILCLFQKRRLLSRSLQVMLAQPRLSSE